MTTHGLMVITSVQGYCRCGRWGMATEGGLDRLRELHAEHAGELVCRECNDPIDQSDPRAGHGLCASCLHDALRSGWEPGR